MTKEALRIALEALEGFYEYGYDRRECYEHITAIKAALEAKDEPASWKLVPIEPTDQMLKAMDECSTEGYDERLYAGHAASVYMAAVNVAPSPSQQHAEDLAKLGWQYFECPACGSEGAKAFPKSEAKDEKHGSPCPEFWDWLPKSYRNGDADDLPKFTKYNMEVAFLAGKQSVALEAKDEPWEKFCDSNCVWTDHHPDCKLAQRTWAGLTDEDIGMCLDAGNGSMSKIISFIEAKLKEKNT
jgi:hypothetical protein